LPSPSSTNMPSTAHAGAAIKERNVSANNFFILGQAFKMGRGIGIVTNVRIIPRLPMVAHNYRSGSLVVYSHFVSLEPENEWGAGK